MQNQFLQLIRHGEADRCDGGARVWPDDEINMADKKINPTKKSGWKKPKKGNKKRTEKGGEKDGRKK